MALCPRLAWQVSACRVLASMGRRPVCLAASWELLFLLTVAEKPVAMAAIGFLRQPDYPDCCWTRQLSLLADRAAAAAAVRPVSELLLGGLMPVEPAWRLVSFVAAGVRATAVDCQLQRYWAVSHPAPMIHSVPVFHLAAALVTGQRCQCRQGSVWAIVRVVQAEQAMLPAKTRRLLLGLRWSRVNCRQVVPLRERRPPRCCSAKRLIDFVLLQVAGRYSPAAKPGRALLGLGQAGEKRSQ
jgi:hypothetical protein